MPFILEVEPELPEPGPDWTPPQNKIRVVRIGKMVMTLNVLVTYEKLRKCFEIVDCNLDRTLYSHGELWSDLEARKNAHNVAFRRLDPVNKYGGIRVVECEWLSEQNRPKRNEIFVRFLNVLGAIMTFESSVPLNDLDFYFQDLRDYLNSDGNEEIAEKYRADPLERMKKLNTYRLDNPPISFPVKAVQTPEEFHRSTRGLVMPHTSNVSTHVKFIILGQVAVDLGGIYLYRYVSKLEEKLREYQDEIPEGFGEDENVTRNEIERCSEGRIPAGNITFKSTEYYYNSLDYAMAPDLEYIPMPIAQK